MARFIARSKTTTKKAGYFILSRNLNIVAISGSTRSGSSNTALLKALSTYAPSGIGVELYSGLQTLPIFSPDLENTKTPEDILELCKLIADADGLVISSPEYVHAIPGGLKNAIDWLVSREEIIRKPIALITHLTAEKTCWRHCGW